MRLLVVQEVKTQRRMSSKADNAIHRYGAVAARSNWASDIPTVGEKASLRDIYDLEHGSVRELSLHRTSHIFSPSHWVRTNNKQNLYC